MTMLTESPLPRHEPMAPDGPTGPGTGPPADCGPATPADQSGAVRDRTRTIRSWPLLLLALPAAAEVWSGWVGIAQKTGFGLVPLLPGIWSSLRLDTTITLPIGVEAYAAYALRAWLATEPWISPRTRRFAKWSAICSFALGMAGQIAYHLLAQADQARAPWTITTIVSCLPVLVLAMGTTLHHMLRGDAAVQDTPGSRTAEPTAARCMDLSPDGQLAERPDQDQQATAPARTGPSTGTGEPRMQPVSITPSRTGRLVLHPAHPQKDQAHRVARELANAGRPVSRRALRSGGIKGSNEALNALARTITAELANEQTNVA
jgi:hypothetical protein